MQLIVDTLRSGTEHMARDERLAQEGVPTMRLFRWDPPACSLGWKQSLPVWLDVPRLLVEGLGVVERPTGGGAAFHGSDLACAVVAPVHGGRPLRQLMEALCGLITQACRSFGVEAWRALDVPGAGRITVCLTEPSSYAVFAGTRKLAGFAVRRYPESWLIQGSVLVRPLPEPLVRILPAFVQRQLAARAVSLSEAAGRLIHEEDLACRIAGPQK